MVFNFGQDTIVGFMRLACAQELAVSSYFNSGQLLADTKLRKNIAEQIVGADLARDFTEEMEGSADVLRYQLAADAGLETLLHRKQTFSSLTQRLLVPGVGYNLFLLQLSGLHHLQQSIFKLCQTITGLGRNKQQLFKLVAEQLHLR